MPKISVIMPAYNAEKYIAEAIDSILGQTYGDFEFIILNDCSKDRTEEIILSYTDPRIVYLKNEKNMGVAATLNRGLSAAKGEYIARMDADDISLPERFAKQIAFLEANKTVAVLGTQTEHFSESKTMGVQNYCVNSAQLKIDLLFASALAHPSVMMRRAVITALKGYDTAFDGMEDYELWCRVVEKWDIAILPQVLLRYRIHPNQVTQQVSPRKQQLARKLKEKQLQQLGLATDGSVAEAFYNYRAKEKKDYAKALAEIRFFEAVLQANQVCGMYDQKLLEKLYRNLAKSNAWHLPAKQQRQLCRQTKLLTYGKLMFSKLKNKLMK